MEEKFAKVHELLENEAFTGKLAQCGNIQEVLALFAANGAELLEEELRALVQPALSTASGELGTDELDQVAGGLLHFPIHPIQPIPIKIVPVLKKLLR